MIEFYRIPDFTKIINNIRDSKEWCEMQKAIKDQADAYPFEISSFSTSLNEQLYEAGDVLEKYGIQYRNEDVLVGHSVSTHVDSQIFGNYYFLNIAIQANHEFGYNISKKQINRVYVNTGNIFLIDTKIPHWFGPLNFHLSISELEPYILFNFPIRRKYRKNLQPFFINNE